MGKFSELYNKLFGKREKYKFVAYINKNREKISDDNIIIETIEIDDFSRELAYKKFIDVLITKYGDDVGIRIL